MEVRTETRKAQDMKLEGTGVVDWTDGMISLARVRERELETEEGPRA